MATGRHPFHADSLMAMLHAIHSESPVLPSTLNPHIPPPFESLILAMLHKDPSLRPTAAEVDVALIGCGSGNSPSRTRSAAAAQSAAAKNPAHRAARGTLRIAASSARS